MRSRIARQRRCEVIEIVRCAHVLACRLNLAHAPKERILPWCSPFFVETTLVTFGRLLGREVLAS